MKKIILFILFSFLLFNQVYAKTGDLSNDLTIKELGNNIKKLKEENLDIKEKNINISKDFGDLVSFIKDDITKSDFNDIKIEIKNFIEIKSSLEQDINDKLNYSEDISDEKEDLIIEKTNFYKFLLKYVKDEKLKDFYKYMDLNIEVEKEKKDIKEELSKSQKLLDKKVSIIKEEIENHKEKLSKKLESTITTKFLSKINEIDKNEKYKSIDQETKNKIYQNFVIQIKDKISEVEKSNLSKNYQEVRIKILNNLIFEINKKISEK